MGNTPTRHSAVRTFDGWQPGDSGDKCNAPHVVLEKGNTCAGADEEVPDKPG